MDNNPQDSNPNIPNSEIVNTENTLFSTNEETLSPQKEERKRLVCDTSEIVQNSFHTSPQPTLSSTTETLIKTSENSPKWLQPITTVLKSIKSVIPFLWLTVIIVVIIPLIGEFFIVKAFQSSPNIPTTISPNTPSLITSANTTNWTQIEKFVALGLKDARQIAENYASEELEKWVDTLGSRIDSNFLDWYFGYYNQKQIEYQALFTGMTANVAKMLNSNSPDADIKVAEVITGEFQSEFAKRVLRPQISQLTLERIATQTAKKYLEVAGQNISQLPQKLQIDSVNWKHHLKEISINVANVDGTSISLPLKTLLGGGAYLAIKPLILPLLAKIGTKISTKLAGKLGAKIAAKTGGVLASNVGSVLLDSTIGVGILMWDLWDTYHTASIEKPLLRQTLFEYLHEMKESLLLNPENGIMTIIDAIENNFLQSLDSAKNIINKP